MQNEDVTHAEKMLEERNSEVEDKWLTFWMDKQLFGVSIAGVEQIVSKQHITEVPDYPAYAKGIINLRGSVIPVVDLRLRLGKPEIAYTDHTCIIIINVENTQFGFLVDEVDAVQAIPQSVITPPPQLGADTANPYLTGVARIPTEDGKSEKMVLCLDAARVMRQDEQDALQQR